MTQHERDRLQVNYNKIPKDIKYLTASEADLKRDLVQCIEAGEDFCVAKEQELKRLRREHHLNSQAIEKVTET